MHKKFIVLNLVLLVSLVSASSPCIAYTRTDRLFTGRVHLQAHRLQHEVIQYIFNTHALNLLIFETLLQRWSEFSSLSVHFIDFLPGFTSAKHWKYAPNMFILDKNANQKMFRNVFMPKIMRALFAEARSSQCKHSSTTVLS